MRRTLLATGAVAVALVTGCTSNAPGDLTASASARLKPAVQAVREAAATGQYSTLQRAVNELLALVKSERDNGDLSASRAVAIQDAADILLNDARPTPSPTPTPVPTTVSPTPSPSPTPTPTTSPTPTATPTPTASTTSPVVSVSTSGQPLGVG